MHGQKARSAVFPPNHPCIHLLCKMDRRIKSGDDKACLISAVVAVVEKSLGLHRKIHLVLERRVAVRRKQPGVVGNRFEQRLDPRTIILGKIGQHVSVYDILQTWMASTQPIAGMTYSQPYTTIAVTNMRGDRTQPVVACVTATDLDPQLGGRKFDF